MTQEAGTRRAGTDPPGSGRLRLALAAALIVVVLAGIRAARPAVGLHGPWHSRGTLIGVALEVVLAALMLAVIRRSRRTPEALQPAAQLRAFLRIVLLVALIATPAAIIINALGKIHLRPRPHHQRSPGRGRPALTARRPSPPIPATPRRPRTPPPVPPPRPASRRGHTNSARPRRA